MVANACPVLIVLIYVAAGGVEAAAEREVAPASGVTPAICVESGEALLYEREGLRRANLQRVQQPPLPGRHQSYFLIHCQCPVWAGQKHGPLFEAQHEEHTLLLHLPPRWLRLPLLVLLMPSVVVPSVPDPRGSSSRLLHLVFLPNTLGMVSVMCTSPSSTEDVARAAAGHIDKGSFSYGRGELRTRSREAYILRLVPRRVVRRVERSFQRRAPVARHIALSQTAALRCRWCGGGSWPISWPTLRRTSANAAAAAPYAGRPCPRICHRPALRPAVGREIIRRDGRWRRRPTILARDVIVAL